MNKSLVTRFVLFAMLSFTVAVMGCGSDGDGPAGSGGTAGTGGGGMGGDGGMGGGGTGGGMGGTGGSIGAVTANPAGQSFTGSIEVTLTTDTPDATICYSTDLSPVVNEDGDEFLGGTEYTGPITITDTAVLKFAAVVGDCDAVGAGGAGGSGVGSFTPEQREGYVDATGNPIRAEWAKSGHGDIAAEPWRHWDWDDPQEVSGRCSRCHAPQAEDAPMDLSFLAYASTGAEVAAPVALGIDCVNCHQTFPTIYSNLAKFGLPDGQLEPTTFPSDAELSTFSSSNTCLICHQGRDSGVSVQEDIDADDGVGPYGLPSIHYYAAAATFFGAEGNGGYHYPGEEYKPRNVFGSHPDEFSN
ncbi:MAG: chitobiase/beta-hexosaminidase C-terminal domain-containing protein, partial [Polyangiales bacterium]